MRRLLSYGCCLLLGLAMWSCKDEYVQHDLYRVWEGNLYGYINSNGEKEIGCQFAYALPFSENLAAVNVGGTPNGKDMPTDGRWGFIDINGRFKLNPTYHSPENGAPPFARKDVGKVLHEAYMFRESVAAVRTDNGWRYIDTTGTPLYQEEGLELQSCRAFHQGLAAVMADGYWGYIKKVKSVRTGKDSAIAWHIPPRFLYPVDFQDSFAVVKDREGRRVCIDHNGKQVFSQYRIESQFHNGMAAVRAKFRGEPISELDNRKFSLMDTLGRLWFTPQFDEVGNFASNMLPVRVGSMSKGLNHQEYSDYKGGRWGFVDRNGEFFSNAFNPIYDEVKSFSENRCAYRQGKRWGYLDQNGSVVAKPQFLWAGDFEHGVAMVLMGPSGNDFLNHYAYIDRSGNVIWLEEP
jgi:hypothetical protein